MAEQTYLIFNPTRIAFLRLYLIATFLISFGIALFFFSSSIPLISDYIIYILLVFFAVGLIVLGIAEILRKRDKYAITSNRIVEKSGIINIEEDSIYWEKVSNYEVSQNLFDRILKVGTIKLWSVGGENEPEVVIKKVSQIKKIRFLLDKLIQRR